MSTKKTERLHIVCDPDLAEYLRARPEGYGAYLRQLVEADRDNPPPPMTLDGHLDAILDAASALYNATLTGDPLQDFVAAKKVDTSGKRTVDLTPWLPVASS